MSDEKRARRKGRGASRKSSHVDARVGARIRQRRVALGQTLQELASRLGVSFQQLQKYEAGDSRMPVSRLHDIAQTMAVPITWFFVPEIVSTGSQPDAAQEVSLQRETDRLVSLFSAIEDLRVRQAIIELVTLFADMSGKRTEPAP
jgi:transcriptional regulator with XRE-family HTH domain